MASFSAAPWPPGSQEPWETSWWGSSSNGASPGVPRPGNKEKTPENVMESSLQKCRDIDGN